MKKLKFVFSSADEDDEFVKVKSGAGTGRSLLGKCPRWDFDTQSTFLGVVVGRRTQRGDYGEYMVYEVLHSATKKPYVIFGSTVLDEKFADIKDYSKIKVESLGKPKGKRYHNFEVSMSSKYVFNPADFPDFNPNGAPADEMPRHEAQAVPATVQQPVKKSFTKQEPTKTEEGDLEDPPF